MLLGSHRLYLLHRPLVPSYDTRHSFTSTTPHSTFATNFRFAALSKDIMAMIYQVLEGHGADGS